MSDKLVVTITGNNGVSRVFQEVVNDAEKLGQGVTRAGEQASRAMGDVGKSATQMAESVETSNTQAAASAEKIGSAIGKVGLAFGAFSLISGQAAGESEASAARMQTAFQNAGFAVDDYQARINALTSQGLHLAFDDEDVQDALSRLVTTTGNVDKAFKDVTLAENIARGENISLASATQLVVQAESGRFRGLAQLGIVLDSTATKQDYLAAAQQKFAGQADAFATTGAANFERWKNAGENALESVGSKLEGLQMPILAVSTAATALGPMVGTLKEIANSEKLAELGSSALSAAMGPAGLVGAAGLAVGGVALLVKGFLDYRESADAAKDATQNLQNLLYSLATGGAGKELTAPLTDVTNAWGTLAAEAATAENKYELIIGDLTQANQDLEGSYASGSQDLVDQAQAKVDALNAERDALDKLRLSGDQIDQVTKDIDELFAKPGIDAQAAGKDIEWYFSLFETGQITAEKLVSYLDASAEGWTKYSTAVVAGTDAIAHDNQVSAIHLEMRRQGMAAEAAESDGITYHTRVLDADTEATIIHDNARRRGMADEATQTKAIQLQTGVIENQGSTVGQTTSAITAYNEAQKASPAYSLAVAAAQGQQAIALNMASVALQGNTSATYDTSKSAALFTEAMKRQADAIANAKAEITDYRARLGEVHMVVNDGTNQFAKHATIAGNALDAGQQVIIGNTNAIAQSSQGVADWADKLIGVKGVYAEIDKLLAKGTITIEEYNKAQSAETSILHSNAAIQRDVLKIQTDQAPVMARLVDGEQQYMDKLAAMPAAQQLVTLGFMDTAESAKALAGAQLAAAAANGELGDSGEATATKMITAAAEADPVLMKMYEDMNLISVNSDTGEIKVNFDQVKGGDSAMNQLIDTIGRLATDLEQIFGINIEDSSVTSAHTDVDGLADRMSTIDGTTATVSVSSNASQVANDISLVGSALSFLNGQTATTTVIQQTVSSAAGPAGRLGGVMGYAAGGVVARMAEAGPEMLTFPNGNTGLAVTDGLYNVPRGTYVDTAPATKGKVGIGGVHIANATFNFNGLTSREQISQQINEVALGGSR